MEQYNLPKDIKPEKLTVEEMAEREVSKYEIDLIREIYNDEISKEDAEDIARITSLDYVRDPKSPASILLEEATNLIVARDALAADDSKREELRLKIKDLMSRALQLGKRTK